MYRLGDLGKRKNKFKKMKRIITRLVLVALLISGGKTFAQKDGFSLHLSGVFPTGWVAESHNEYDFNGSYPSMGTGFGVGFKYQFHAPELANLRFLASAELMYNPLNGKLKDAIHSMQFEYSEEDFKITLPKYFNIPLMVGLNYAIKLNDKINIFGEVAAGINLMLSTNFKEISVNKGICNGYHYWDDDYYYDYDASYDYTSTHETTGKYNAITFAYRFGAGVTFDRISIGLHWYRWGKGKVSGESDYKEDHIHSNGDVYHHEDKGNKFNMSGISMLTLTVGYHF